MGLYPCPVRSEGCKLRPLVNADPCILTNRGSDVWGQVSGVRCQVSGLRGKRGDQ